MCDLFLLDEYIKEEITHFGDKKEEIWCFPLDIFEACTDAGFSWFHVSAVWHGGVQLSEVGVGWGRQSGAAVSHGHFYERLHNVRHPGKRHFRALRAEPHVSVWQHRLHSSEIHRQAHSTLYIQGKWSFILITNLK